MKIVILALKTIMATITLIASSVAILVKQQLSWWKLLLLLDTSLSLTIREGPDTRRRSGRLLNTVPQICILPRSLNSIPCCETWGLPRARIAFPGDQDPTHNQDITNFGIVSRFARSLVLAKFRDCIHESKPDVGKKLRRASCEKVFNFKDTLPRVATWGLDFGSNGQLLWTYVSAPVAVS